MSAIITPSPTYAKSPPIAQTLAYAFLFPSVYIVILTLGGPKIITPVQLGFFLLPAILLSYFHRQKGFWQKTDFINHLIFTLGSAMVLTVLLNKLTVYSDEFFPLPPEYLENFEKLLHKGQNWGLTIDLLQVCLLPAICEEFFFRGLIQTGLGTKTNKHLAVFIAAALFTLFHFNPWYAPFYFALGLYFGYLFLRTRNLGLVMLAHFLNNAYGILMYYYFGIVY
jgi:membrane protease YdiL (CAAX protease family)